MNVGNCARFIYCSMKHANSVDMNIIARIAPIIFFW